MKYVSLLAVVVVLVAGAVEGKRKKTKEEVYDEELPDEARLYQRLTDKYDRINPDRAIIPVRNVSETEKVGFGVALISFPEFDPDSGIALFNLWERYMWKDAFLSWDPEDFGGIAQIRIPISKIWKPDLVLYNAVDPEPTKSAEVLAIVYSDGSVMYIPRLQQRIICEEPGSGIVNCTLKYGSWTYDGYRMDLEFYNDAAEVDVNDYIKNTQYTLLDHSGKRHEKYYPCCKEPYLDLTFTLIFKKNGEWWQGKK